MTLNIAANAMRCPIFIQLNHKAYSDLGDHKLATVKAFWIKKYKAHSKHTHEQAGNNNYDSAVAPYNMKPPSKVTSGENDFVTYVSALEGVIVQQMVEKEEALTVTTRVTQGTYPTAASNPTVTDLMAEMKNEMATLIAAAMAAAAIFNGGTTGGHGNNGRGGGNSGGRWRKPAYGKDKNGNDLPKCPHCIKPATHKPNKCFSLPKNAEKMKMANFVNGKFVKKTE